MTEPRDVAVAEPETTTTHDIEYQVLTEEDLEKPYRVMIQNDDVTPMDVVVWVLHTIFELSPQNAMKVMFEAHETGVSLVTVLPFSEAHDRVYAAHSIARSIGYPLTLYLEPDV